MQPSDDPVPRPRPRVGTQLPGMADGGYLKPTSRPRVATNPISVTRDPSPTQHRRTTSDAKNDKEEPIYDTPWGKRLHPSGPPPVARKPASPSLGVPPGREKGGSNDTTPATQTQQSARSITPTRPPTRPPPFQAPSQRVSSPLPSPTPPPTVGGGRPKSISSNSGDEETPLSPKRQAPPPPASMGVNTSEYSRTCFIRHWFIRHWFIRHWFIRHWFIRHWFIQHLVYPTLVYPTLVYPTLVYPAPVLSDTGLSDTGLSSTWFIRHWFIQHLVYLSLVYPTLVYPTLVYPTLVYLSLVYPTLVYPTLVYPAPGLSDTGLSSTWFI